jgi:hypothetical protein
MNQGPRFFPMECQSQGEVFILVDTEEFIPSLREKTAVQALFSDPHVS